MFEQTDNSLAFSDKFLEWLMQQIFTWAYSDDSKIILQIYNLWENNQFHKLNRVMERYVFSHWLSTMSSLTTEERLVVCKAMNQIVASLESVMCCIGNHLPVIDQLALGQCVGFLLIIQSEVFYSTKRMYIGHIRESMYKSGLGIGEQRAHDILTAARRQGWVNIKDDA